MRTLFYLIVGLLLGSSCTYALGQETGRLWLTTVPASYHTDREKDYNERHFPSLGLEWHANRDTALLGGYYLNSRREQSVYIGAAYTPWQTAHWRFGAAALGVTGYDKRVAPAFAPTAMYEYGWFGFNVLTVGTITAVQLKLAF